MSRAWGTTRPPLTPSQSLAKIDPNNPKPTAAISAGNLKSALAELSKGEEVMNLTSASSGHGSPRVRRQTSFTHAANARRSASALGRRPLSPNDKKIDKQFINEAKRIKKILINGVDCPDCAGTSKFITNVPLMDIIVEQGSIPPNEVIKKMKEKKSQQLEILKMIESIPGTDKKGTNALVNYVRKEITEIWNDAISGVQVNQKAQGVGFVPIERPQAQRISHGSGKSGTSRNSDGSRRFLQQELQKSVGLRVNLKRQLNEANAKLIQLKKVTTGQGSRITSNRAKLKNRATQVRKLETQIAQLTKKAKEAKIEHNKLEKTLANIKTSVNTKTSVKTVTNEHIQKVKQETNGPPGFTKTNIERLLQPFKQPVTVKFAPTISVKGGSAKATGGSLQQTQIQYKTKAKTPANKKKKPLKLTRGPATARKQESAKFRNAIISKLRSPVAAKRREALYSLRTPTTGQRKKHVIELIDRVLRRMKVRADVEKKLIKFYESLSERHIKQLFGGRTKEGVKAILKKQVDYFSKKR